MTTGEIWAAARDQPQPELEPGQTLTWREAVDITTREFHDREQKRAAQAVRDFRCIMETVVPADAALIIDWINDDLVRIVVSDGETERILIDAGYDEYGSDGMRGIIAVATAVAEAVGLPVETRGTVGR